eukprot:SAG11_NODE_169_length_13635_cov_13.307993_1_plen_1066_part_00
MAELWRPKEWTVGYLCDAKDKYGTQRAREGKHRIVACMPLSVPPNPVVDSVFCLILTAMDVGGWYEAKILAVSTEKGKVQVHFKGWGRENGKSKWDQWMAFDAETLAPFQTKSAQPPEEIDEDSAPVVDAVLDKREKSGVVQYKVRWIGASEGLEDWQTELTLRDKYDADEEIDNFAERSRKRLARKQLESERKAAGGGATSSPRNAEVTLSATQEEKVQMVVAVTSAVLSDAISALRSSRWDVEAAADRLLNKRGRSAVAIEEEAEEEDDDGDDDDEANEENDADDDEENDDDDDDDDDNDAAAAAAADDDDDDDKEDEVGKENEVGNGKEKTEAESGSTAESADALVDKHAWHPKEWTVGYLCDAQDKLGSPWCVGKVLEVEEDRVKIHFQGWAAKWDEWMVVTSDRLAPHKTKSTKEAKAKAKLEAEQLLAKKEAEVEEAKNKAKRDKEKAKKQAKAMKERAKKQAKKQAEKEKLAAKKRAAAGGKAGTAKAPRPPTAYNLFMRAEIQMLKDKDSTKTLTHQAAFKLATGNWKMLGEADMQKWKKVQEIAKAQFDKKQLDADAASDAKAPAVKEKKEKKKAKGGGKATKAEKPQDKNSRSKGRKRAAAEDDDLVLEEEDLEAEEKPAKAWNPKKRWKEQEQSRAQDIKEDSEAVAEEEAARREVEEAAEAAKQMEAKRTRKAEKRKLRLRKAAKNLPKEVLDVVYLRRTTLLHWLEEKDFATRVKGCIVRVATPNEGGQTYQMGIIDGVFNFRAEYAVDWAKCTQGLLVSRKGQKGVVRLEMLSNLDCGREELASLFEMIDDPTKPSPVQQLEARAESLQQHICELVVQREMAKLKALTDKYNATGNRAKLKEAVEKRTAMKSIQESEDWAFLVQKFPDVRPFPRSTAYKDDEVWAKLKPSMEVRDAASIAPRVTSSPKGRRAEFGSRGDASPRAGEKRRERPPDSEREHQPGYGKKHRERERFEREHSRDDRQGGRGRYDRDGREQRGRRDGNEGRGQRPDPRVLKVDSSRAVCFANATWCPPFDVTARCTHTGVAPGNMETHSSMRSALAAAQLHYVAPL